MILPRRSFLTGLAALITAPAIVRPESIMKVKAIEPRLVSGTEILARQRAASRIFMEGDLIMDGVIIRMQSHQAFLNSFRGQIVDSLLRNQHLFGATST